MIVFSLNDNPRYSCALQYVSAIAISNGGSNGEYRIFRLMTYSLTAIRRFYQTVFPPDNTLTIG